MRKVAILLLVVPAILVAGCGSEEASMKTDPKTVMNPTGDPSNLPPQAQGWGEKQKEAGEASARNMDEMSRQMNAARDAAGKK